MQGYETTWPVFLVIIALYIAISLVIGGRKAYFEPFEEKAEEPEQPKSEPTHSS